jgi:hypothetical protein
MYEKKKFIQRNLKSKPSEFKNYSKLVRANHDLALIAIRGDPSMFQHVDKKLKTEEFVKEAIVENEKVLQFINQDLLHRPDFLMEQLPHVPTLLLYLNEDYKINKEFILKSVEYFGISLRFISFELLLDENFMLECVKVNPCTFPSMLNHFQKDPKFIKKAIEFNPFVVSQIEFEERKEEYYIQALKKDIETIKVLPEEYYNSPTIIDLILYSDNAHELKNIGILLENRKLAIEILRKNGNLFRFLPKSSKIDKELILISLKTNEKIFDQIPMLMRRDIEIQWLTSKNFKLHKHLPSDINFHFL